MSDHTTLDYYNQNSQHFVHDTQDVKFTDIQDYFLSYLKPGALILDFGCGSGRDTKYFLEKGYSVEAIDGSEEMVKIAREYTGIEVKQMLFQELFAVGQYDGIWACSSILHLPRRDLVDVLQKISIALKTDGVLYTSFKYGEFEGIRNGRYFIDLTEESFELLMLEIPSLRIIETWITSDVRPGREDERWLNILLKKTAIHM